MKELLKVNCVSERYFVLVQQTTSLSLSHFDLRLFRPTLLLHHDFLSRLFDLLFLIRIGVKGLGQIVHAGARWSLVSYEGLILQGGGRLLVVAPLLHDRD